MQDDNDGGLNRSELIIRISQMMPELPEPLVDQSIRVLLDQMVNTLAQGDRIEIRGFGSFALHHREPRVGRNPKTGESVEVTAKAVPHFKPGKAMRDAVNEAAGTPVRRVSRKTS